MISNRSLHKNEKKLFNENPSHGRATLKYALKAMFEEKIRYDNNGEDGSDSNAFLHAYWSAVLAKNIDQNWVYRWTNVAIVEKELRTPLMVAVGYRNIAMAIL